MSNPNTPPISPELKALFKQWVIMQKEKYGEGWKEKLAKEMPEKLRQDFVKQFLATITQEKK